MPNLYVPYYRTRDGNLSIKAGDRIRILKERPFRDGHDRQIIEQLNREGKADQASNHIKRLEMHHRLTEYINHIAVIYQLQIQLSHGLGAEYSMIVDFGDGQKIDVFSNECDFEISSRAEDNPQVQVGDRVKLGTLYDWSRNLDRNSGDTGRVTEIQTHNHDGIIMRDIVIQWDKDGEERVLIEWECDIEIIWRKKS